MVSRLHAWALRRPSLSLWLLGALLLVSDSPITPEGVKTSKSDLVVTQRYVATHLEIGINALIELRDAGESVKHLRYE